MRFAYFFIKVASAIAYATNIDKKYIKASSSSYKYPPRGCLLNQSNQLQFTYNTHISHHDHPKIDQQKKKKQQQKQKRKKIKEK